MHNFVPQLATWQVVSGGSASPHGPPSHILQSLLVTWRVVTQSCVRLYVPSITLCNNPPKEKSPWVINFLPLVF